MTSRGSHRCSHRHGCCPASRKDAPRVELAAEPWPEEPAPDQDGRDLRQGLPLFLAEGIRYLTNALPSVRAEPVPPFRRAGRRRDLDPHVDRCGPSARDQDPSDGCGLRARTGPDRTRSRVRCRSRRRARLPSPSDGRRVAVHRRQVVVGFAVLATPARVCGARGSRAPGVRPVRRSGVLHRRDAPIVGLPRAMKPGWCSGAWPTPPPARAKRCPPSAVLRHAGGRHARGLRRGERLPDVGERPMHGGHRPPRPGVPPVGHRVARDRRRGHRGTPGSPAGGRGGPVVPGLARTSEEGLSDA